MKYKAVLFDLDGTLADTLADLAAGCNKALADFGYPPHEKEKYKYFVGNGAMVLMQRILPVDAPEGKYLELRERFNYHYGNGLLDTTCLFDGIEKMLNDLKAEGVKLAVFSNKPHDMTKKIMDTLCKDGVFECVYGQSEKMPRKPDPTALHIICKEIGVTEADCVYVGDSGGDMKVAAAAGMDSIGVLWGFRKEDELCESGATHIAKTVHDITDIVLG
ncbi:MAG: HAD family hydrolase [Ruminococcaceae bacterium]|nr:HAD family hydrolase [Oscillospiraceae bacterium]